MDETKVAVLLEDLMSQFRTFGEGLEGLRDEINNRFNHLEQKLDTHIGQNRLEHHQLMQMVKELDHEVHVEVKRIK